MCHRERAPAEFEADTDVLSSYKKNLKRILVDISEYMLLLGLNKKLLHEYFRLWRLLESMHLINLSIYGGGRPNYLDTGEVRSPDNT